MIISFPTSMALAILSFFGLSSDAPKETAAAHAARIAHHAPAPKSAPDTLLSTMRESTTESGKKHEVDARFEPIIEKLVSKGWPEEWVRERFADKRTEFLPKMVAVAPKKKSTSSGSGVSSAYRWVNTDESADACLAFIARYDTIFAQAEQTYGIPRELVAALMRCETQHGKVTGTYHVFSVYASMALMEEQKYIDENLERAEETLAAQKADSAEIVQQKEYIRNRSVKRGSWAFGELESVLKIQQEGSIEAMGLYGSWAGAFGWSQFIPSSYRRLAVDGSGDGRVDLFNPADAIHSVANYLRAAGYKADRENTRKALFDYNNSSDYANSIMALAERVSGRMKAATKATVAASPVGAVETGGSGTTK